MAGRELPLPGPRSRGPGPRLRRAGAPWRRWCASSSCPLRILVARLLSLPRNRRSLPTSAQGCSCSGPGPAHAWNGPHSPRHPPPARMPGVGAGCREGSTALSPPERQPGQTANTVLTTASSRRGRNSAPSAACPRRTERQRRGGTSTRLSVTHRHASNFGPSRFRAATVYLRVILFFSANSRPVSGPVE